MDETTADRCPHRPVGSTRPGFNGGKTRGRRPLRRQIYDDVFPAPPTAPAGVVTPARDRKGRIRDARFHPDKLAVIRADVAVKTVIMEGLHNTIHIQRAILRRMSGFVEIFILNQLNIAHMGKMEALTTREFGKNFIDVIIRIFRN